MRIKGIYFTLNQIEDTNIRNNMFRWVMTGVLYPAIISVVLFITKCIIDGKCDFIFLIIEMLMLAANIFINIFSVIIDKKNDGNIADDKFECLFWTSLFGSIASWIFYSSFYTFFMGVSSVMGIYRKMFVTAVAIVVLAFAHRSIVEIIKTANNNLVGDSTDE